MKYTRLLSAFFESAEQNLEDIELVNRMKQSSLIEIKKLKNNVISLNFGDTAFQKGIWNDETTKARGLFFDDAQQKIIARGYDKFFNLGEDVAEEKLTINNIINNKIQFPVKVWHKYNGYLGILSVHETKLDNIIYSGVFFKKVLAKEKESFAPFKEAYPQLKINIDFPHITFKFYKNNMEEANKLNDAFANLKRDKEWKYTFSKLYVSKDGKLIATKVDSGDFLGSYTPETPHVTLYAEAPYKPVDSAKLIEGKIPHDVYTVKPFVLKGRLAHYNNEKKLQPMYQRTRLFVASKSTDAKKFANNFRILLIKQLYKIPGALADLREYLIQKNASIVFEVIDIENDPHIISYNKSSIVLLDIIRNTSNFKSLEYNELKNRAKLLKIDYKKEVAEIANADDLQKFVQDVTGQNYELETKDEKGNVIKSEPVEGFVFQGSNDYMFKIKTNYYNFWKKLRSAFDTLEKHKKNSNWKRPTEDSIEYKKYLQKFLNEKEILDFALDSDLTNKKIIAIRDEFMAKNPNFQIKSIVFDSDDSKGVGELSDTPKMDPLKKAEFSEKDTQFYGPINDAWLNLTKITENGKLSILGKYSKLTNFSIILDRAKDATELNPNIKGKYTIEDCINTLSDKLKQGKKLALVLIGPPGSGKSTFINELKTKFNDIIIHSTDDKFIDPKTGIYKYQRDKLDDYHALVQKEALMNMQKGTKIIALDNTNLQIGNFSYSGPDPKKNKFTNFAIENGYTLHFIFFLTNPNIIYGEKGVSSEARIKSGKAFFGDTGKTTVYNFLYKYLSKGFIELLGGIQKFDKQ